MLIFDLKRLKNNITNLRLQRGLSLAEVAEKIGLTREGILKWEEDPIRVPSIGKLIELCNFYDVGLDDLLFGTISPPDLKENQSDVLSFAEYAIYSDPLFKEFYIQITKHFTESIKNIGEIGLSPVKVQATSKYIAFKTFHGRTPIHFLSIYPSSKALRCIFSIPWEKINHEYLSFSPMNATMIIIKKREINGFKLLIEGRYDIDFQEILKIAMEVVTYVMQKKRLIKKV